MSGFPYLQLRFNLFFNFITQQNPAPNVHLSLNTNYLYYRGSASCKLVMLHNNNRKNQNGQDFLKKISIPKKIFNHRPFQVRLQHLGVPTEYNTQVV